MRKNTSRLWTFALIISIILFSCQKEPSDTNAIPQIDVYVAGWEQNSNRIPVAKYWKNGQAISISDGTGNAYASSMAVVGSDVYVAGEEFNGFTFVAKYRKNGQAIALTVVRGMQMEIPLPLWVAMCMWQGLNSMGRMLL